MIYFITAATKSLYPLTQYKNVMPKKIAAFYLFPEQAKYTEREQTQYIDKICEDYDERYHEMGKHTVIISSSSIMFYQLRVNIRQGRIDHEHVKIIFYGRDQVHRPNIDMHAKLDYWPDYFFDTWDKQLDVLL